MTIPHVIRPATIADMAYIVHLQSLHSNAVGFIPTAAIEDKLTRNYYTLIEVGGMAAGYLMASHGIRKPTHLTQIAIDEQLWRNGIGRSAIEWLLKARSAVRHPGMTAHVREGLEMNAVCVDSGAVLEQIDRTPRARKLPLNKWRWVTTSRRPEDKQ